MILIPVLLASPVRLMGFYEFSQTISFPHIDFFSYLSKIYIFLWMLTKTKCARTHLYSKADMWSSVVINCDIPASYILQSQKYGLKKIISHTPRSRVFICGWKWKYVVECWNKEMILLFPILSLQIGSLGMIVEGAWLYFLRSMFWEQTLFTWVLSRPKTSLKYILEIVHRIIKIHVKASKN